MKHHNFLFSLQFVMEIIHSQNYTFIFCQYHLEKLGFSVHLLVDKHETTNLPSILLTWTLIKFIFSKPSTLKILFFLKNRYLIQVTVCNVLPKIRNNLRVMFVFFNLLRL